MTVVVTIVVMCYYSRTLFPCAGWGLDWLWPFLLGYPARQVAFIDDVCVIHPQKELQDPRKVSMYSVMQRPYGEEYEQYARSVSIIMPIMTACCVSV